MFYYSEEIDIKQEVKIIYFIISYLFLVWGE